MNTTLDSQALTLIEEHVRRLLDTMGFAHATVRCRHQNTAATDAVNGAILHIELEAGDEGKLLIGNQGNHLAALQHIIRCLLRRQIDRDVYITLDINGYRARREQSLLSLAEATARRAKMQGRTIVLRPMAAADRRMIHTALASRQDISTESMGDEPNRRVIVKPIFL